VANGPTRLDSGSFAARRPLFVAEIGRTDRRARKHWRLTMGDKTPKRPPKVKKPKPKAQPPAKSS
jgi:hypothetical protein